MWKIFRIAVLLVVLGVVAAVAWLDQASTTSWDKTLWVGIFPLNGDGSEAAARYIDDLTVEDFASIETFFAQEAVALRREDRRGPSGWISILHRASGLTDLAPGSNRAAGHVVELEDAPVRAPRVRRAGSPAFAHPRVRAVSRSEGERVRPSLAGHAERA